MIMTYAVMQSQYFCSLPFHFLPLPVLSLRVTSSFSLSQTSSVLDMSLKFHLFAKIDTFPSKAIIPDVLNKLVVISMDNCLHIQHKVLYS